MMKKHGKPFHTQYRITIVTTSNFAFSRCILDLKLWLYDYTEQNWTKTIGFWKTLWRETSTLDLIQKAHNFFVYRIKVRKLRLALYVAFQSRQIQFKQKIVRCLSFDVVWIAFDATKIRSIKQTYVRSFWFWWHDVSSFFLHTDG